MYRHKGSPYQADLQILCRVQISIKFIVKHALTDSQINTRWFVVNNHQNKNKQVYMYIINLLQSHIIHILNSVLYVRVFFIFITNF